jgi:STE24 endopeptidase
MVSNLAPDNSFESSPYGITHPFLASVGIYVGLLALIVLQAWVFRKKISPRLTFLVNFELLVFLVIYYLFLGGHQTWQSVSLNTWHTVTSLEALLLYFGGLFTYYFTIHKLRKLDLYSSVSESLRSLLIMVPFILPFLVLTLFADLIPYLGAVLPQTSSVTGDTLFYGFSIVLLLLMFAVYPYFIQLIWRCVPLNDPVLVPRLQALCDKAQFKHAGFKIWTVLNTSVTAAIVGIIPRFRYLMFTQGLLQHLTPDEVEAVLAHEIGHTRHHHLIIYPFIILAGVALSVVLNDLFLQAALDYFYLKNILDPSPIWFSLELLTLFVFNAVFFALYFRFVFGYFSRLFERQADLSGVELGLPADNMRKALDTVAIISGNIHSHPSWHHYSIDQRMQFLKEVGNNSQLVEKHNRTVRRNLKWFFLFLCLVTFAALSSVFTTTPPFKQVHEWIQDASEKISSSINQPLQIQAVKKLVEPIPQEDAHEYD